MNHYDNGQTVLNDWTAFRLTVGKGWVYDMTEREWYENPTYPQLMCEPHLAKNVLFCNKINKNYMTYRKSDNSSLTESVYRL